MIPRTVIYNLEIILYNQYQTVSLFPFQTIKITNAKKTHKGTKVNRVWTFNVEVEI